MADCQFERDCLSAPIPDKCFFYCVEQILRRANPSQKRNVLKISGPTADAIFAAYQRFSINSFEDLANHINPVQLEEVIRIFRNVSQEQLNHFK
jgi:hypothetical protein